jgi:hypothetical protein
MQKHAASLMNAKARRANAASLISVSGLIFSSTIWTATFHVKGIGRKRNGRVAEPVSRPPPPSSNRRADLPHPAYPNSLSRRHAQRSAVDRSQQVQTKVVYQLGIDRPALRDSVPTLNEAGGLLIQPSTGSASPVSFSRLEANDLLFHLIDSAIERPEREFLGVGVSSRILFHCFIASGVVFRVTPNSCSFFMSMIRSRSLL